MAIDFGPLDMCRCVKLPDGIVQTEPSGKIEFDGKGDHSLSFQHPSSRRRRIYSTSRGQQCAAFYPAILMHINYVGRPVHVERAQYSMR
jgi:hypothetical protein